MVLDLDRYDPSHTLGLQSSLLLGPMLPAPVYDPQATSGMDYLASLFDETMERGVIPEGMVTMARYIEPAILAAKFYAYGGLFFKPSEYPEMNSLAFAEGNRMLRGKLDLPFSRELSVLIATEKAKQLLGDIHMVGWALGDAAAQRRSSQIDMVAGLLLGNTTSGLDTLENSNRLTHVSLMLQVWSQPEDVRDLVLKRDFNALSGYIERNTVTDVLHQVAVKTSGMLVQYAEDREVHGYPIAVGINPYEILDLFNAALLAAPVAGIHPATGYHILRAARDAYRLQKVDADIASVHEH